MLKSISLLSALAAIAFGINGCGGSSSVSGAVVAVPTPVMSSITPNPAARGTSITITGQNFKGVNSTAVFNGATQATTTATSGGTTSISILVLPVLPAGQYSVTVETTDGQGDISAQSNAITVTLT
jgi:hypothetical protein